MKEFKIGFSVDIRKVENFFRKLFGKPLIPIEESMSEQKVKEIADKVLQSVGVARTVLDVTDSSETSTVGTFIDTVELIVSLVEQHSEDVERLKGEVKKEIADLVVSKLVKINIKYVPQPIMASLERWIVGLVIDFVVGVLNRKLGKQWVNNEGPKEA